MLLHFFWKKIEQNLERIHAKNLKTLVYNKIDPKFTSVENNKNKI